MMKGVVERGTGGAARALKRPIAGKTGTSQSHRDMWFIGMTPDIAAAAWMGYDDDTSQESGRWTGGGTVAYWWTDIMQEILKDQPATDFTVPEGISFAFVNPDTGKLAQPTERNKILEAFKKGTEPSSF
jgi:penicillin-binding protein 1A